MTRVLVVGWDGATWSVAGPLCEAGRLPTLDALRMGGAEGILRSVPNMNSAPAWSTVATGRNPGGHGIFYFDEPVRGKYRRRVVNASDRTGPTLWKLASEAGKRVVVVNVPISYPAEAVNGFMVAGLDTPSKELPGFTYPRDLSRRFPELLESYVIEPGAPSLVRAGKIDEAREKLIEIVEGWVSVTERLMEEDDWDLVFIVFTSSDTAQHFFWTEEGRSVIERVYEVQDAATGRLVQRARATDPGVHVLVIADHGGEANSRGPEFMPIWLEDQGLQARTTPALTSRILSSGFNLLDRTLTREQKLSLARWFPKLREQAESEARTVGLDWRSTTAYSDGRRDDVLVNLEGREPQGQVPVSKYEAFLGDLKRRVEGIRELDSGEPVVAAALTRAEAYPGPLADLAPDLTIHWNLGRAFRGFRCDTRPAEERMREVAATPPIAPGGHHPDGLFVANGPYVRQALVRAGLEDITPTVLALLGVPLPEGLDGRPLDLLESIEVQRSARSATAGGADESETAAYTPEQEEAVRKRLEDLGYL